MKIDKLRETIREVLENQGIEADVPISENTSMRDDLHFDSFALAELFLCAQKRRSAERPCVKVCGLD